ncbi:hypothetical protein [Piscinibacter koreensis]|uniref:Uncharacterized protein n=1 Tax=Piscinibacter koreensis TaxID=2742824 RepID=A0A7Y6NPN1_9BURK|nr:hypothetical protein [Schlegelella koreensis]NUZ07005.1 hypothetical protein [Schlegelella koreensis]
MPRVPRVLRALGAGIALNLVALGALANPTQRDGTWWLGLEPAQQVAYATGFLDGNTYAAFAVAGTLRQTRGMADPARGEIAAEVVQRNVEAIQGEVDGVAPEQLAAAANRIYADERNRGVSVAEVFYAGVRTVRGWGDAEIERFLQTRRRSVLAR